MGEEYTGISRILHELFSCEDHLEFFSNIKGNQKFITFPNELREEAEENLENIKNYVIQIKENFGEFGSFNQIKGSLDKLLTRTNAALLYLNQGNMFNMHLQFSTNYFYALKELLKFHKRYEDLTKTEHLV